MVRNGLMIFNSVHKVMRVEKAMKGEGLEVKIMPVPRQLSSDCGLTVTFSMDQMDRVEELLEFEGLVPDELYRLEGDSYSRIN